MRCKSLLKLTGHWKEEVFSNREISLPPILSVPTFNCQSNGVHLFEVERLHYSQGIRCGHLKVFAFVLTLIYSAQMILTDVGIGHLDLSELKVLGIFVVPGDCRKGNVGRMLVHV